MRGEQVIFNLDIMKKRGLSLNPDIHHSKVPSSDWGFHSQNCCAFFLRNETQNLSFVARKKTAICAIIRKSHFPQNCPILLFQVT